jgi:hypothetical protein
VEAINIAAAVPKTAGKMANRFNPDRIRWNLDVFMGGAWWKPVLGTEAETVVMVDEGNDRGSPHDTG